MIYSLKSPSGIENPLGEKCWVFMGRKYTQWGHKLVVNLLSDYLALIFAVSLKFIWNKYVKMCKKIWIFGIFFEIYYLLILVKIIDRKLFNIKKIAYIAL